MAHSPSLRETIATNGWTHFGVGSLPFNDPKVAVDFILQRPWLLPWWPELPRLSKSELMMPKAWRAARSDWRGYQRDEAAGLFELLGRCESEQIRFPLLKHQLPGPLTMVFWGRARAADSMDDATQACVKQMEWLLEASSGCCERHLFVLDEPALCEFDALPPEERKTLNDFYSYLCVRLVDQRAFLGFHCCGRPTAGLFRLPGDFVSFEALQLGSCAGIEDSLSHALASGVVLAVGAYPAVVEPSSVQTCLQAGRNIIGHFRRQAAASSADSEGLVLHSANCGHAAADPSWVEALYARNPSGAHLDDEV